MKLKSIGLLILLMMVPQTILAVDGHAPMVISVAWTSPDTRYLRLHAEQWQQLPFTGTLVTVSWPQPEAGSVEMGTGKESLSWAVFQKERFTPEMLKGPAQDLSQTKFTSSKDNFLWVVSYLKSGEHFDWFDDAQWETVLHNIESLAKLAKDGGLRGLVFDAEEYNCSLWSYGGRRPKRALKNLETYKGKSWEQVRDKVRQRGRSFIKAVNKGYPGCPVWLLFGYSVIIHNKLPDDGSPDYLSDERYSLYANFLDGMLEASDDETIFIDGCESSYRFSEPEEFIKLREFVTEKALRYTNVPEIYQKKMRVGFGLYLDMENNGPWHSDRPNDNAMTPARLQKAVENALKISDGYVWIYNEYPSWWLDTPESIFGKGVRSRDDRIRWKTKPIMDYQWIPRVYWEALRKGMATYSPATCN